MKGTYCLWGAIALLCVIGGIASYELGFDSVEESDPVANPASQPKSSPRAGGRSQHAKRVAPEELATELVSALKNDDREQWATMESKLKRLSWKELSALWEELRHVSPQELRFQASWPVFRLLVDRDPARALEMSESFPLDSNLQQMVGAALGTWASREPLAALEKALEMGSKAPPRESQYISAVFREWAQVDFEGALRAANGLKEWGRLEVAVRGLASSVGRSESDSAKLLERYGAIGHEPAQALFLERGVQSWIQKAKRDEVERWIDGQEFDFERQAQLLRALARGASFRDPQRTAEWLLARSTSESRAEDLVAAVDHWAERQPEACGRWLDGWVERAGAGADIAISEYSRTIAGRQTQEALEWAGRIQDGDVQADAYKWIVRRMGPIPDGKVREYLEQAGLNEETISGLVAVRPRR